MKITRIPCRYWRLLRTYRHIAHVNHGSCHICERPIEIGQQYEGEVSLTEDGICVIKCHVFCPDDFWQEQEEEAKRWDEETKMQESRTDELAVA